VAETDIMMVGSRIDRAIEDYVTLRRALGFKMHGAPMLRSFARFLSQEGASHITVHLALLWAKKPTSAQPAYWASRLRVVRQFAQYMSALDPLTEVPPVGLLPFRSSRREPYIYTNAELRRLLRTARRYGLSKSGLDRTTYPTLIALLAVTGLRSSEIVALDDGDVDLEGGVLTIRETKFRKSRLVPIHPTSMRALQRYRRTRDRLARCRFTRAFFVNENGRRLLQDTVQDRFRKLCLRARVGDARRPSPRLHDFRHRLAILALVRWYRQGADVERRLPVLSTYLGHAHVEDTYWYLSASPDLLRLAAERAERTRGT
jgi:integrase/recombinase XerD